MVAVVSFTIPFRMVLRWCFKKIEEYVRDSHELISRRWKKKGKLGVQEEIEIGEPETKVSDFMALSNTNPIFLRRDTKDKFEFKVRNLIGFKDNMFSLEVDPSSQEIIIRTTNKKYFKRFKIPDMARYGLKLDKSKLSMKFINNTLYVYYEKPEEIKAKESQLRQEMNKLNMKNCQEGDLECTTQ